MLWVPAQPSGGSATRERGPGSPPNSTTCFGGPIRRSRTVPDLVFVLLTVGLFALLAMAVRGVERL